MSSSTYKVKSYEAKIHSNIAEKVFIADTLDLYRRGGFVASSHLLNLLGGFDINFDLPSPKIDKTIVASLMWFSLEVPTEENQQFQILPQDISTRFEEYSGLEDPIIAGFDYDKEKYIWVDRKLAFTVWNKTYNINVESIFSRKDLPLFMSSNDDGGANSQVFWNSIYSLVLGAGKKNDRNERIKNYKRVYDVCSSIYIEDHVEFANAVIDSFGGLETLSPYIYAGRGAKSRILSFFENPHKYSKKLTAKEFVLNAISDDIAKITLEIQLSDGKLKQLLSDIMGQIQMPENREHFSSILSTVWRALSSSLSNRYNQILNKIEIGQQLINKPEYYELLSNFEKENNRTIRLYSLNNYKTYYEFFKISENSAEAFEKTVNEYGAKNVGEHVVFQYLIKNNITPDAFPKLQETLNYLRKEQKFKELKLGGIPSFLNNPIVPSFGESRPQGKLVYADSKMAFINLNLYDKKENIFNNCKIKVFSKRACKEIFFNTKSDKKVFRNDNLNNPNKENVSTYNDFDGKNVGMLLNERFDKYNTLQYYLKISPKMQYESQETNTSKILGVDLGQRKAGTFSIFNISEQSTGHDYEIEVNHKDTTLYMTFEKADFLEKHNLLNKCILSDRGETSTAEDIEFFKSLLIQMGENIEEINPAPCVNLLLFITRKLLWHTKNEAITNNHLEIFESILNFIGFAEIKDLKNIQKRRSLGGLTFSRIELFQYLKNTASSIFTKCENGENAEHWQEHRVFYQELIERLTNKSNNIRTERVRLTANAILTYMLKNNIKCCSIEDLDFKSQHKGVSPLKTINNSPTKTNKRFLNSRNRDWCSRKIVKTLIDNAQIYGLTILTVSPLFTSHLDIFTNEKFPILQEVEIANLNVKKLLHLQKNAEYENGFYAIQTKKMFDDLEAKDVDEFIDKLQAKGIKTVLIPNPKGWLYPSSRLGVIDVDLNSSILIAKRGVEGLINKMNYQKKKVLKDD